MDETTSPETLLKIFLLETAGRSSFQIHPDDRGLAVRIWCGGAMKTPPDYPKKPNLLLRFWRIVDPPKAANPLIPSRNQQMQGPVLRTRTPSSDHLGATTKVGDHFEEHYDAEPMLINASQTYWKVRRIMVKERIDLTRRGKIDSDRPWKLRLIVMSVSGQPREILQSISEIFF